MHTMARTFLVHASLYRTERGSDDLSLSGPLQLKFRFGFIIKFQMLGRALPLELITRERSDYKRHPPLSCVGLSSVCP